MSTRMGPVCLLLSTFLLNTGCSETSSEQHILTAEQYIAESRFQDATIELKNAVQKDPNSAKARWLLGHNYFVTGQIDSAAKELVRAQQLGWPNDQVIIPLAKTLLAQGQYVAVSELPRTKLEPEAKGELLAVQALSAFTQGESVRANELIKKALTLAPDNAYIQITQARILFAQQDYSRALATIDKLLATSPSAGLAWSVRGDINLRQGKLDEALKAYDKAIEFQSYSPAEHLKRALIQLQQQNYGAAMADAKIILADSRANPGANYVKGTVQFQRKKYPEALRSLSLAKPSWKKFPLTLFLLGSANLLQGNLEQAATYAGRFYNAHQDNIAGRKLLATIYLKQKQFTLVEELLEPVLDTHSGDADLLTLLANAFLFNNRIDEGIALLMKVSALDPASASARLRLGTGLILSGKNDDANEQFEAALRLDPEFQQAGVLLILSHLQKGDYAAAIAKATDYLDHYPSSVVSYNLLGRSYLENDQQEKARQSFEKALDIAPGDPSASHQLAKMALAKKQPDRARSYYNAALAKHNNHLFTMIQLAVLDAKAGDEQAVFDNMERAITAHPNALEPRLLLGRYYLALGKPEHLAPLFATLDADQRRSPKVMMLLALSQISESDNIGAQYTLEDILRSTPETPQAYHLLAMSAAGTGDPIGAREALSAALGLDPEFLPSRLALARMDLKDAALTPFREHLEALVELAPESADVLQLRAASAALDKQPAQAVTFSRAAFQRAPATHTALEYAHYLLLSGNSDTANDVLKAWITERPSDTLARLSYAKQLQHTGLPAQAESQYEAILEREPKNLSALKRLSRSIRHRQPKQSLVLAERALDLAPDNAEVLDTVALAAFANKNYSDAGLSIRRAILAAPENPTYRYHNALILSGEGNTDSAIAVLKYVLGENTTFEQYDAASQLLNELNTRD